MENQNINKFEIELLTEEDKIRLRAHIKTIADIFEFQSKIQTGLSQYLLPTFLAYHPDASIYIRYPFDFLLTNLVIKTENKKLGANENKHFWIRIFLNYLTCMNIIVKKSEWLGVTGLDANTYSTTSMLEDILTQVLNFDLDMRKP